ncbi:MAG: hypothetical protein H6712_21150 [Myxococcales bacterium]|nr:hypothetical protein [Myxococcales bacterium]
MQWPRRIVGPWSAARSFVPERRVEELRELTRTRKQTVRDITRHAQRIDKLLQGANIKMRSVLSEVLGKSGKAILRAMVEGENDPDKLANLARFGEKEEGRARRSTRWLRRRSPPSSLRQHLDAAEHMQGMVDAIEADR